MIKTQISHTFHQISPFKQKSERFQDINIQTSIVIPGQAPVTCLQGLGRKHAAMLASLGPKTVSDPRRQQENPPTPRSILVGERKFRNLHFVRWYLGVRWAISWLYSIWKFVESDDDSVWENIPTHQQVEGDVGVTQGFHDAPIAVPDWCSRRKLIGWLERFALDWFHQTS